MSRSPRRIDRNDGIFSALGQNSRVFFGASLVLLVSFLGIFIPTLSGLYLLWPIAPLWAAFGWGHSGGSVIGIIFLVIIGFGHDLLTDAAYGNWGLVYLLTYSLGAFFRPARAGDSMGMELGAWVGSLLAAYGLTVWLAFGRNGASLFDGQLILSLVLTGLLYRLDAVKSFFKIRDRDTIGV